MLLEPFGNVCFLFLRVCFWISPSLQFLISSSQSTEDLIAAVSLSCSMRERCLRTLVFLWGWWALCLKKTNLAVTKLDYIGKFLPFFFPPPLALKAEKRRKLTQGKVLTGRLVYDLIFNLFFTYIYEKSVTIINKTALIMYCKSCLLSQIHLHTVSSAALPPFLCLTSSEQCDPLVSRYNS